MRATVITVVVLFSGSIAIIAPRSRVAVMGRMVLSPLHRATEMEAGASIQAEAVVAIRAEAAIQVEAAVAVRAEAAVQPGVAAVIQGGAAATAIQRGLGSPEEPSRVPRLAPAELRVNREPLDPLRISLTDNLIQQLPSDGQTPASFTNGLFDPKSPLESVRQVSLLVREDLRQIMRWAQRSRGSHVRRRYFASQEREREVS